MSLLVEDFVARLGWEVDSKQLKTFGKQAEDLKKSVVHGAKIMGAAFVGIGWGLSKIMHNFSVFENAEAQFQPMLGSLEKAQVLVERLKSEAESTPFQFENLANVSAQLLPLMNGDIEKTIGWMRTMGDLAGGNVQRMDSVVRSMSRVFIKGRADMESLNIMSEGAKISIFKELAQTMGLDQKQIFDALRQGKVSMEIVEATLRRMTSKGGMYFEGMELSSRTLTGRISTLKDTMVNFLAWIGKAFAPEIKGVVESFIRATEHAGAWAKANQKVIKKEFVSFLNDVKDVMGWIVSIGKSLIGLVQGLGGFKNTIKAIGIAIVAVKLAPFALSLSGIIASVPTMSGALVAAGGAIAASWLPVAALFAGIFLLADDIKTTVDGGKGVFYEQGDAIATWMDSITAWRAELAGVSKDSFYAAQLDNLEKFKTAVKAVWDVFKGFFDFMKAGWFGLKPIWDTIDQLVNGIGVLFNVEGSVLGRGTDQEYVHRRKTIGLNETPNSGFKKGTLRNYFDQSTAPRFAWETGQSGRQSAPIQNVLTLAAGAIPININNPTGSISEIKKAAEAAVTGALRKAALNMVE